MQQNVLPRLSASSIIAAIIYLLAFTTYAYGLDNLAEDIPEKIGRKVEQLQVPSNRRHAEWIILQERGWTIFELMHLVQNSILERDQKKTAKIAIRLLGDLRAVEAISLLVDNLTVATFYDEITGQVYSSGEMTRIRVIDDDYSCVGALIKIGSPSIEPLITKAEETDDELFNKLTAIVLVKVLNPRIAVAYLSDRLEHQADSIRRKRLTVLLQHIQSGNIQ